MSPFFPEEAVAPIITTEVCFSLPSTYLSGINGADPCLFCSVPRKTHYKISNQTMICYHVIRAGMHFIAKKNISFISLIEKCLNLFSVLDLYTSFFC